MTDFLSRKTFPDGIEYLDFLLHITALPGYPYQFPHFFVEVLESALKALLVVPLVLLQGFQLLSLPHGPLNAFFGLFGSVPVHVANHGFDKLILYGLEGGTDIILIMLHSSAPLPHPGRHFPLVDHLCWNTLCIPGP